MKIKFCSIGLLFTLAAHAQEKMIPTQVKAVHACESELTWSDSKPPLLPGAKVTVLEGNPKTEGHFTIRIKLPPWYKIPPHFHPSDERTTVLSGSISIGMGDVMDTTQAQQMNAGCFYVNPSGVHHYAFTSGLETELQISTNGPWGTELLIKQEPSLIK
jgi:quercetin dioxygenase-like cupin family protein